MRKLESHLERESEEKDGWREKKKMMEGTYKLDKKQNRKNNKIT